MADLRTRLRAIETARPPDLWPTIDERAGAARPQDLEPGVVAFRSPRAETGRRAAAIGAAAAVLLLGAFLVWRESRPVAPVPRTSPTDAPAGWVRCENGAIGYSIAYPSDWFTTDLLNGERDPANACRWFSSTPYDEDLGTQVVEGYGHPLEVRIRTGDHEAIAADETVVADVLARDEVLVDGRPAVRLELEYGAGPIVPAGTRVYEYVIDLGPEQTMIVLTADQDGIPGSYEDNRVVVDDAVGSLRFG
jgi:hypothetical protein